MNQTQFVRDLKWYGSRIYRLEYDIEQDIWIVILNHGSQTHIYALADVWNQANEKQADGRFIRQ